MFRDWGKGSNYHRDWFCTHFLWILLNIPTTTSKEVLFVNILYIFLTALPSQLIDSFNCTIPTILPYGPLLGAMDHLKFRVPNGTTFPSIFCHQPNILWAFEHRACVEWRFRYANDRTRSRIIRANLYGLHLTRTISRYSRNSLSASVVTSPHSSGVFALFRTTSLRPRLAASGVNKK